jgi:site-specific DNA-adenine methylase
LEPLNNLTLLNLDYKDVEINTPKDETIVYLDPPYRGTAKYIEDLNHEELDNYFKSSPYTCFMSEYEAPFKSIMEIEKLNLMNNYKEKTKVALEKLFINRST